ncbi:hypothetical protein BDK89_1453 [Ilumatobacter fluminis]|uniref:Uncharacterized protein n=1 Tax=Ilumatobacter fluminis TaxID=467091 RepID=A0A4R7HYU8_9ACTN|nr:hypothetical protein [Ilumatobacter fluminis]TDT15874.1 hypothetical protein BDK89_1453 [Ilumatobacter fluminis]
MHALADVLPSPWADLDWASAGIAAADLSWWGGDHDIWRAIGNDGESLLAKAPRAHDRSGRGATARSIAGELGVGPEVVFADSASGVTVERELGAGWRVATLWRVRDRRTIRMIGDARRRVRDSGAALPGHDIGAEVAELLGDRPDVGPAVGLDQRVIDAVPQMRSAVAHGPASVPGWLSAEISDVLVHEDGSIRLTGGGVAGSTDPLADVGALLTELSPLAGAPRDVFTDLWGGFHPGAYARARVWGVLADLRDYLRAERAYALEPTSPVSFGGYRMRKTWRLTVPFASGEMTDLLRSAGGAWR